MVLKAKELFMEQLFGIIFQWAGEQAANGTGEGGSRNYLEDVPHQACRARKGRDWWKGIWIDQERKESYQDTNKPTSQPGVASPFL
jgi:hypothetical protein